MQIGTAYRQCQTGSACTLHWITPAPATIPRWQLQNVAAYTGSFAADEVHSRVDELIRSDNDVVYKLTNGQYWINHYAASKPSASVGDECWVVPGRELYSLYVGQSRESVGVQQVPVVLDTEILGITNEIEQQGVYQLEGGGYWRVFSGSKSSNRRALLATPNNVDYWLFTEGRSEDPVYPAAVHGDSTVSAVSKDSFQLADGNVWGYLVSPPSVEPSRGDHAIVYEQALINDEDPDMPLFNNVWIEGRTRGQLLLVLPAR